MIDPADNVTRPLSVTAPMRVIIDMPNQVVEAALVQDLLGDWFVTQKITGKSTSGRLLARHRNHSAMVSHQEEGFSILSAVVKNHEKKGGKICNHPSDFLSAD